jgi:hypothetical protein
MVGNQILLLISSFVLTLLDGFDGQIEFCLQCSGNAQLLIIFFPPSVITASFPRHLKYVNVFKFVQFGTSPP